MKRNYLQMAMLTMLFVSTVLLHAQKLAIQDGDRVVFYGDSITAQRLYTRFIEDFFLTRYPKMHVSFWNAGVPGDRADGGYTGDMPTRIHRDLEPHQPTVVTIMLGMNDGYYVPFEQKYFDFYKNNYRKLLGAIHDKVPSARITLISPTTYDEITHGTEFAHYGESVDHNAAFVKEFAVASHLGYCNFNETETRLLNAGKCMNPTLAALLVPDRIHPSEASHLAMAAELARCWGVSPIVSSVRIDAQQSKVVTFENTHIADLKKNGNGVQWTQLDNSLPLPLQLDDAMTKFVLEISDLASMDQQILRVDNLPGAKYRLKIDGHGIALFTNDELAKGINLALYSTPMESQAKGVDGQEVKRTRLDEVRFILNIEEPKVEGSVDAAKTIAQKDADVANEQYKDAQPKSHTFELIPE